MHFNIPIFYVLMFVINQCCFALDQYNITVGFTDGYYRNFGFVEVEVIDGENQLISSSGSAYLSSTNMSYPGRYGSYFARFMNDRNYEYNASLSMDAFPLTNYSTNPFFSIAVNTSNSLSNMSIYTLPTWFSAVNASKWLRGAQVNITRNGTYYDSCVIIGNPTNCKEGLAVFLITATNTSGTSAGIQVSLIGAIVGGIAFVLVAAAAVMYARRNPQNFAGAHNQLNRPGQFFINNQSQSMFSPSTPMYGMQVNPGNVYPRGPMSVASAPMPYNIPPAGYPQQMMMVNGYGQPQMMMGNGYGQPVYQPQAQYLPRPHPQPMQSFAPAYNPSNIQNSSQISGPTQMPDDNFKTPAGHERYNG